MQKKLIFGISSGNKNISKSLYFSFVKKENCVVNPSATDMEFFIEYFYFA